MFCLRGSRGGILSAEVEPVNENIQIPPGMFTCLKTVQGQMHIKNKVVPIVAVPDADTRCNVYVLDLYMQKLPCTRSFLS